MARSRSTLRERRRSSIPETTRWPVRAGNKPVFGRGRRDGWWKAWAEPHRPIVPPSAFWNLPIDNGGFCEDAAEGQDGEGAEGGAAGRIPHLETRYSHRRSKPWKCGLHRIKEHSLAAPSKVGGSKTRKTPRRKRLRCGRNANAAVWRFLRPLTILAPLLPAAKAA